MRWQTKNQEKELQPIKKMSDTTTTLRRPPSGMLPEGGFSHERIRWEYGMKGEKLDRREEVMERADDDGSSEKWPPAGAQVLAAQK